MHKCLAIFHFGLNKIVLLLIPFQQACVSSICLQFHFERLVQAMLVALVPIALIVLYLLKMYRELSNQFLCTEGV